MEDIVHPFVAEEIRAEIGRAQKEGAVVLLVEGALLFHSPSVSRGLFHLPIRLEAPEEARLRAAGLPHGVAEARLAPLGRGGDATPSP